ncbi:hypothetical protein K1T71_001902 [Dendrolimus kikuchii]|uniref:Uncharacterized protein n=1 Tax=Dendrolimus kikuchii TaxID=765133 RepID=A0ACC1DFU4_9NEOP|nr:hypothetical protein K1T71_001902 [Dendrolimus kikuchii]
MAIILKDLCRLCAQKDEFSKDLFDENNKNILKVIQDFIQIIVYENDDLPTKICLNCEEKMVSFQLFVLECCKTQESLKKLYLDSMGALPIKLEINSQEDVVPTMIKAEVKDEMTAEDIVSALNNESALAELDVYDDSLHVEEDDDDYLDDIAIASLKEMKRKKVKKKELTDKDFEQFNELLKRNNLKVKDFVKFDCDFCEQNLKTWNSLRYHYVRMHKCKPVVFCLCGYEISSKSVLYKHVSDHKSESKKLRKAAGIEEDKFQQSEYAALNVKDFVSFKCTQCHKVCSSWYTLREHCEKVHKILPIVHCACGITLKSKSVMYKHIQDHKNPNVLACDKCPRIAKSVAALNKHKMRHVPKSERKFCCSSCDKIFNSKDALKSHERSHIPIEERKIYHCEVCNMKFTTRSSAASHKRVVHDKIKAYVCDLCGYACGTNGELRQHRAIHSEDKPFVCRKCGKPFKTYSNLKTHMDTHEETSYECFICRRVLNSRRTLRKHLLVHEDKCRHICSYCNKAFKRRQTLKVHMYTHTGDKPLTCKWCEERFSYASTLRSHRLRCHPDKMAANANDSYHAYHLTMQQNFIKDDVPTVGVSVTKNEVEIL